MPRPRARIPNYRLHKASGQAVVTLGGRDVYLGKYDTPASREAYERAVIEWKAHGHVDRRRPMPLAVAGLVARFLEQVERDGRYVKHGRPTSERHCLVQAFRPLCRLFGTKPATEFMPADLKIVRHAMIAPTDPTTHSPITRRSANKHVHRIRMLFRWAVVEGLVPETVWIRLRAVEAIRRGQGGIETADIGPAPLRAVVQVLRAIGPVHGAMIRLQFLSGMRPGEVVQMRMRDIDRSGPVWIYQPGTHKTEHRGQAREVPLGPRAQKVLAPFVRADPAAWLFPGKKDGTHLTAAAYAAAVAKAVRATGADRWTPNQLRHNAATRARRTHGIDTARTLLGHGDAGTTLIYAEQDRQKATAFALAHG